jgi:hypothetical protein
MALDRRLKDLAEPIKRLAGVTQSAGAPEAAERPS